MYADDTSVTCSAEDIYDLCNDLKAEIDNIAEWLRQNKLSVNTEKTEYMVIGHKRQTNRILGPLEVNVNGEPIKRAQKVMYLGITVDENLTWNEQYKNLKGKIKNALSSLWKLKNILPQSHGVTGAVSNWRNRIKLDQTGSGLQGCLFEMNYGANCQTQSSIIFSVYKTECAR